MLAVSTRDMHRCLPPAQAGKLAKEWRGCTTVLYGFRISMGVCARARVCVCVCVCVCVSERIKMYIQNCLRYQHGQQFNGSLSLPLYLPNYLPT